MKVSPVAPEHRVVTAPARVFDDQGDFLAAFDRGELDGDLVAVVRHQGPRANGMPELHKLTPALGLLMDRGHRVALVTDGRMSGASGKIPAALHCTPEAAAGGPLSRLRDGDVVRVDAETRAARGRRRPRTTRAVDPRARHPGTGRELFAAFRERVGRPDEGASVFGEIATSEDARMTVTAHDGLTVEDVAGAGAGHPGRRHRRPRGRRPAGRALVRGGLPAIEVTLRTPAALAAIERIAAEVEGAVVGAGTVTTPAADRRRRWPPARASSSPRARRRRCSTACRPAACRSCPAPRRRRTSSR